MRKPGRPQLHVAPTLLFAAFMAACGGGGGGPTPPPPAPAIQLSAATLAFSASAGGANPASQTFTISNSGGGALAAPVASVVYGSGANWLTATVSGSGAPYTVTVQPSISSMSAGAHTATISISSAGASNSPRTVAVTLALVDSPPVLASSAASVAFSSRSYPAVDPASRSLTITNAGGGTLSPPDAVLEFPDAIDWLDGTLTGAAAPYTITLQPKIAALGLGAGTYTATLRVTSTGASNTLAVPVTLTLTTSWTVFVYGHGDHTLSGSLLADIQEMNQATLGDSVTVLVAADYSAARTMPDGTSFPVGTVAYEIVGSGSPPLEAATGIEQNFDDPAVLTAWTQSAFETYPADRHAIVLWDHGGSWKGGFGGDEQNVIDQQGAPMAPATVAGAVWTALGNAGLTGVRPLEFLAFDTCLMMGNEVAYEFNDLADVYLAAAEIDFGNGWDYQASLSELGANPDVSALAFGALEVDHWDAHHASAGLEDFLLRAHAAIDLTRMNAYATSWRSLATTIAQSATVDWLELARTQFGTAPGYQIESAIDLNPQPALRDAGQLLAGLRLTTSDPNIASAATSAETALSDLFIRTSLGAARAEAGQWGMQVEAPLASAWLGRATAYSTLAWDAATGWSSVLDGLAANADSTPPVVETTVQNGGAVTLLAPAVVTLWSQDPDVAFARMYLAETIGGKLIEYGVVGESAIDPDASYQFTWAAAQPALADATYMSAVYVAPWLTAGTTALYLLPGHIGNAPVLAIYEDGATVVDTILVVSSGNPAVFDLEDFGGLSFVPEVLDSTDAVWLDATPLAIPDVAGASLDFGWAQVAAGTYYLGTEMTDVWGNVGGIADSVTVN